MSRTIGKVLLAGTAIASAIVLTTPEAAWAKARLKSMSIKIQAGIDFIEVISTDRKRYTKIKPKTLPLWSRLEVDTRFPGYVEHVGVVLGACGTGTFGMCQVMPLIFIGYGNGRDYFRQQKLFLNTNQIPESVPNHSFLPSREKIIRRCNDELEANGSGKAYGFQQTFWATFIANTAKAHLRRNMIIESLGPGPHTRYLQPVDHTRTTTFTVYVRCLPFIPEIETAGGITTGPKPTHGKSKPLSLRRLSYTPTLGATKTPRRSSSARRPKCRIVSKKTCKRVPKRSCQTTYEKQCRTVTSQSCRTVTTRACKTIREKICRKARMPLSRSSAAGGIARVSSRPSCTIRTRRICRPVAKRLCTPKTTRRCTRVPRRQCRTQYETKCSISRKRICKP